MKTNKEKYRELSKKQKKEYIWEYYKYHIVGIVSLLLIIGSLINTWFINPPAKAAVSITFMNKYINTDETDEIKNELVKLIITEEDHNKDVFINNYFLTDNIENADLDMASNTKFMANISAKELDVIILNKEKFENLSAIGTFLELDKLMLNDDLDKIKDKLVKQKNIDTSKYGYYGIDVTDNEKLKSIMGDGEKFMCIINNTTRLEESMKVINWFLQYD
ncbi:MAG: hypothetical protein N4A50_13565 [Vallitalea sp.]|jgi:hypothetical protein|nr:hypothetical protein [Vallitalea sp.]